MMNRLEAFIRRGADILLRAPDWAESLVAFAIAMLLGAAVHRLLHSLLTRLVAGRDLLWRSLVKRAERPMRLAIFTLALGLAASVTPLNDRQSDILRHALILVLIALVAWMARIALHIWTTLHLRRFQLDTDDNLMARKHVTQSRILQRIAHVLIFIIALAWALMTFGPVRQYGVSLLASAGAAGLVVGLALQPVLKNIFAGIQLALTQPIRIDDALLVEGEWGKVEEITSTYVVVKLWDWRRMILPLSYFIENPFQNWTRETASLIGSVLIYLDFTVPIPEVRAKVEEIVRASKFWDGDVINLQVVDFRETVMEVRILASARNSGHAFDLRCEIREELIGFIRETYPDALPRTRAALAVAAGTRGGAPLPESLRP